MINSDVKLVLGETDIYLADQIMKGRYTAGDVLLDAGCGRGRNLHWFLRNNFEIYGIDADEEVISDLAGQHPALSPARFRRGLVENLPFENGFFDGIISSAVLHFAASTTQFFAMMNEMHRVMKKGGMLFIRMASDIGLEKDVQPLGNGVFLIPDGSTRFLLTRPLLNEVFKRYTFSLLEPFKTVNVTDLRCMSTLVLQRGS